MLRENENRLEKTIPANTFKNQMTEEYPYDTLVRLGKKGEGVYGIVYGAKEMHPDGLSLAVKRNLIEENIDFCGSVRELDLLARLNGHPYVVYLNSISFGDPFGGINGNALSPIPDTIYKDDKIHFIFEEADGDFCDFIETESWANLKIACMHLLLGLEYCHAKGVIHRDIKPANLLIFKNEDSFTLKLCDFGLSKPMTNQGIQTPDIVTSWYRAPEILMGKDYNEKVDLWSVGCVFYEMINRIPLLNGSPESSEDLLDYITSIFPKLDIPKKKLRLRRHRQTWQNRIRQNKATKTMPQHGWNNEQFIDLMENLFEPVEKRYSATQALNHPFFTNKRTEIDKIRQSFPPIPNIESSLSIFSCPERKTIGVLIKSLYDKRESNSCLSDRIIFQGLSIFDRYLSWKDRPAIEKEKLRLIFSVCLYLALKYFITLAVTPSFILLYGEISDKELKWAEEFENHLIEKVLSYIIYEPTVYEAADLFKETLDSSDVKKLLNIMIEGSVNGQSINELKPNQVYSLYREKSNTEKSVSE